MSETPTFLGKGWGFPPTFLKKNDLNSGRSLGSVSMASYTEDINQSLGILFDTSFEERILSPGYGCSLRDFVLDIINGSTNSQLEEQIRLAISDFEPRIQVESVSVTASQLEGQVNVNIWYVVRDTNSRFNFVHPFYKVEATGQL